MNSAVLRFFPHGRKHVRRFGQVASTWLVRWLSQVWFWLTVPGSPMVTLQISLSSCLLVVLWGQVHVIFPLLYLLRLQSAPLYNYNNNIAVNSIAPYLTDKGLHTALYKINNNVHIKTSKWYKFNRHDIVFLTHHTTNTHTHSHTTHVHRRNITRSVWGLGGGGREGQVRSQNLATLVVVLLVFVSEFLTSLYQET